MRGPTRSPRSMTRLKLPPMPPISRTVVKPLIRNSRAAAAVIAPISSQVAASQAVRPPSRIMWVKCTWLSIRPGISVRPPPSKTVAFAPASISPLATFLMRLPSTRTLMPSSSLSLLPSKTLTLVKRTCGFDFSSCATAEAANGRAAARLTARSRFLMHIRFNAPLRIYPQWPHPNSSAQVGIR